MNIKDSFKKKAICAILSRMRGIHRKLHQMISVVTGYGGDDMVIGIIGAGKVGCSIGKYLKEHGITVAGYSSKTKESVESAATFTDTVAYHSLSDLVAASDIIFIMTPDDEILPVWERVRDLAQGDIVCHFSGSLSSAIFSNAKEQDISVCSIHPMYAFSDRFTSYVKLNQAVFTMEGDTEALKVLRPMFEGIGNTVCTIDSGKKERYHAAASMVSNMMIGLYKMGIDMLVDSGFGEVEARDLVAPLVSGNVSNLLTKGPIDALTGPIERGDIHTVRGHLSVLTDSERAVYTSLGQVLVNIAKTKHPDQDYQGMLDCLSADDMED